MMKSVAMCPPIGRCIYCGTSDGPLGKEHVIPFSLGGGQYLPAASCSQCAKVTSRFEQTCARSMFGVLRSKIGLPTRRPKERPGHFDLHVTGKDGGRAVLQVPAMNHPGPILIVDWGPPRLLSGKTPATKEEHRAWLHFPEAQSLRAVLDSFNARGIDSVPFDQGAFARLLAKVAYGFAVGRAKLPADPSGALPRIVLGKLADYGDYVGGAQEDSPVTKIPAEGGDRSVSLHNIELRVITGAAAKYVVATISLFAFLGAPRFRVVVAEQCQPARTAR